MTPELADLAKAVIGAVATLWGARMIASALTKRLERVETLQEQHGSRLDSVEAHNQAQDVRIDVLESQTGLIK